MLDWEQTTTKSADTEPEPGEGTYLPPQRGCLVCGQQRWTWKGERYRCGSSDPTHAEREGWPWVHIGSAQEADGAHAENYSS